LIISIASCLPYLHSSGSFIWRHLSLPVSISTCFPNLHSWSHSVDATSPFLISISSCFPNQERWQCKTEYERSRWRSVACTLEDMLTKLLLSCSWKELTPTPSGRLRKPGLLMKSSLTYISRVLINDFWPPIWCSTPLYDVNGTGLVSVISSSLAKRKEMAGGWRRQHNYEHCNLYASLNIIMVVKSRSRDEKFKVSVGKSWREETTQKKYIDPDGTIILERMLQKKCGKLRTGFMWLRTDINGGLFWTWWWAYSWRTMLYGVSYVLLLPSTLI
jgi:hypothetical protein